MTIRHLLLGTVAGLGMFTGQAQTYLEQYEKYSVQIKKIPEVNDVYFELVKRRDSALVGTSVPNFTAVTLEGDVVEMEKLKGRVVVLNFWFTRCQPCIKEMPFLNRLTDTFKNDDVVFLSFAPEEPEVLEAFLKKHPFDFKVVANGESIRQGVFKLFSAWPYTIIIDKEGKVNRMVLGGIKDDSYEEFRGAILALLK